MSMPPALAANQAAVAGSVSSVIDGTSISRPCRDAASGPPARASGKSSPRATITSADSGTCWASQSLTAPDVAYRPLPPSRVTVTPRPRSWSITAGASCPSLSTTTTSSTPRTTAAAAGCSSWGWVSRTGMPSSPPGPAAISASGKVNAGTRNARLGPSPPRADCTARAITAAVSKRLSPASRLTVNPAASSWVTTSGAMTASPPSSRTEDTPRSRSAWTVWDGTDDVPVSSSGPPIAAASGPPARASGKLEETASSAVEDPVGWAARAIATAVSMRPAPCSREVAVKVWACTTWRDVATVRMALSQHGVLRRTPSTTIWEDPPPSRLSASTAPREIMYSASSPMVKPWVMPGRRPSAVTISSRPSAVTPMAVRGARTSEWICGSKPSDTQSPGSVGRLSLTIIGPPASPWRTCAHASSRPGSSAVEVVASPTWSPTSTRSSAPASAPVATTMTSPPLGSNVPALSREMPMTVPPIPPAAGHAPAATRRTARSTGGCWGSAPGRGGGAGWSGSVGAGVGSGGGGCRGSVTTTGPP